MAKKSPEKDKQPDTWLDVISGNRLAIYTLIVIAVFCLVGTLLPQRGTGIPDDQFRMLMGESGSWGFAARIGLLDVFHSLWFQGLVILLLINLTACSWKLLGRIRTSWKTGFKDPRRNARIGVLVIHSSILLIALGVLVRNFFGIDGAMNIPEGGTEDTFALRSGGELQLPFHVQCRKFTVDFYQETGQPKLYRSDLRFTMDSGLTTDATIEVNKPFAFGGYRFFQASYGRIPAKIEMKITRRADGKMFETMEVLPQQTYKTPDGNAHFSVMETDPDKAKSGFAALISEEAHGADPAQFWIFQSHPEFDQSRKGSYSYEILKIGPGGNYTGIMVARDPGVWLVWTGFAAAFVGIFMTFFLPRKQRET